MSNLHKDLPNDQIHVPKDFAFAANSTKLTKNATGQLEWIADGGGGGGGTVTSLTTSGTSGASTLVSGVLNVPIYAGIDTNETQTSWRGKINIPSGEGKAVTAYVMNTDNVAPNTHTQNIGIFSAAMVISPRIAINAACEIVTSPNPTVKIWNASLSGTGLGTISLFKCNPCGEGAKSIPLEKLVSQNFDLRDGILCISETTFDYSLTAMDHIIPVIALNEAGGNLTYASSIRLQQS